MTRTESDRVRSYDQGRAARDQAAYALYEAELALHDAHQSHVDAWIQAASEHLHLAVVAHLTAEALMRQSSDAGVS
ncbi:MAG: hypothetical protein QOE71_746 [Pseudonocardiales bacterium]|jgi:hypothetical protein|nr:hypothetical protein [Pseudonocardiales bacterium]